MHTQHAHFQALRKCHTAPTVQGPGSHNAVQHPTVGEAERQLAEGALHKCHTHTHTPSSARYTNVTHTQHLPCRAPETSLRCNKPKLARRSVSSRKERYTSGGSVTQVSLTHSTRNSARYTSVTQHLPCRAPEASLRCSTPKSARRSGSSRKERLRMLNMTQCPGQFIGFSPNSCNPKQPSKCERIQGTFSARSGNVQ